MHMRTEKKKINQALMLTIFALGMLLMSYAAVPLYKLFCQVTGYGGTLKYLKQINLIQFHKA